MTQEYEAVVYTQPNCQPCKATKRYFEARGVQFTEVDLVTDESAMAFVSTLGHKQAPVVVVSTSDGAITAHWSGFDTDRLEQYFPRGL